MSSNRFTPIGGGGSSGSDDSESNDQDEEERRQRSRTTTDVDDTPFVQRGGSTDSPGDAFDDATRTSRDADQETEATPDEEPSDSTREVERNTSREGTLVSRGGDAFGGGSGPGAQDQTESRTERELAGTTGSGVPFVEDREGSVRQDPAITQFDRELVEGELEGRFREQVEQELEDEGVDSSQFDVDITSNSDGMTAEVTREERADIDWSFGRGGEEDEVEIAFEEFGDKYAPIVEEHTKGFEEFSQEMLDEGDDPNTNAVGQPIQIDESWIGAGGVVASNLVQDLPRAPSGALELAEAGVFLTQNTRRQFASDADTFAGALGVDLQTDINEEQTEENLDFAADYSADLATKGIDFAAENPRRAALNVAAGGVGEVAAAGLLSRSGRVAGAAQRVAPDTGNVRRFVEDDRGQLDLSGPRSRGGGDSTERVTVDIDDTMSSPDVDPSGKSGGAVPGRDGTGGGGGVGNYGGGGGPAAVPEGFGPGQGVKGTNTLDLIPEDDLRSVASLEDVLAGPSTRAVSGARGAGGSGFVLEGVSAGDLTDVEIPATFSEGMRDSGATDVFDDIDVDANAVGGAGDFGGTLLDRNLLEDIGVKPYDDTRSDTDSATRTDTGTGVRSDTGTTPRSNTRTTPRTDTGVIPRTDTRTTTDTPVRPPRSPDPDRGRLRIPDPDVPRRPRLADLDLRDDGGRRRRRRRDDFELEADEFQNTVNLDAIDAATDVAADVDDLFKGEEF